MIKKICIFLSVSIGLLLGVLAMALMFNTTSSAQVVLKQCQPKNVSFGSYEPYCAAVTRIGKNYHIFIGRDAADFPSYGHVIHYPHQTVVQSDIPKDHFAWSEDGISWIGGTGHTLFIPKDAFLGGR